MLGVCKFDRLAPKCLTYVELHEHAHICVCVCIFVYALLAADAGRFLIRPRTTVANAKNSGLEPPMPSAPVLAECLLRQGVPLTNRRGNCEVGFDRQGFLQALAVV